MPVLLADFISRLAPTNQALEAREQRVAQCEVALLRSEKTMSDEQTEAWQQVLDAYVAASENWSFYGLRDQESLASTWPALMQQLRDFWQTVENMFDLDDIGPDDIYAGMRERFASRQEHVDALEKDPLLAIEQLEQMEKVYLPALDEALATYERLQQNV